MNILKTLFLTLFLMSSTFIYSQIEHKLYVQALLNFYTGETLTANHLGADYELVNLRAGYGAKFGYNINRNLSVDLGYSNTFNKAVFTDSDDLKAQVQYMDYIMSCQLNCMFIPLKKLSPYIFGKASYNIAELYSGRVISSIEGDIYYDGFSYHNFTDKIGYAFGAGVKYKPKVKWNLFLDLAYDMSLMNSFTSQIGLQYNFATKKH